MSRRVETMKKYHLHLNLTDLMKILSVPQDHCGSQNNFMKIFSRNYTLNGVNISINFGFCLNRLAFRAPESKVQTQEFQIVYSNTFT